MSDTTPPTPQFAASPIPMPTPMLPPAAPAATPAAESTPALPPIPNYSVRRETRVTSDGPAEHLIVTFGEPARAITVKPHSLGDQWDLAEITGAYAGNDTFQNMAYVAATVTEFDRIPVLRQSRFDRDGIRRILNQMGMDGLRAASKALGETAPAAAATPADQAMLATAGN